MVVAGRDRVFRLELTLFRKLEKRNGEPGALSESVQSVRDGDLKIAF